MKQKCANSWRERSGKSTGRDLVAKGLNVCKERAVEEFEAVLPAELHFGYIFAKQDVYKLKKIGLEFCEGEPPDAATAGRHPGNFRPAEVEPRGTRMCTGGDKLLQSVAQAVTSPLKSFAKRLPLLTCEPEAFKKLLDEVEALQDKIMCRRVDKQSFGMGTEQSIVAIVLKLPVNAGFGIVAGDSIVLYVNRGPPANLLVARQDHAKFAPREADTDCLRELDEAKVAVQTAKEEIEGIDGATDYFKS